MNAPMNRRQFFRICATGLGSSSVVGLGFSPQLALAEVRAFKLAQTTRDTRHVSVLLGQLRGHHVHPRR